MAVGDNYPVLMGFDKAAPGGVATLDASGNVPIEQLGNVVRCSLVDNGYFLNSVNQRGQTEYVGTGYTIDRWTSPRESSVITIADGHITLAGVGGAGYLRQYVEHPHLWLGKTLTFSVLYADNTLLTSTGKCPESVSDSNQYVVRLPGHKDTTAACTLTTSGNLQIQFGVEDGLSDDFVAVKLELGSAQTLAHQDADGKWVLNEIPDYGEELRKCRRFYRQSFEGSDPAGKFGWSWFVAGTSIGGAAVSFDEPMRGTPTVKIYDSSGVEGAVDKWANTGKITGVRAAYRTAFGFAIDGTENSFTPGTAYKFHYTASADL